MVQSLNQFGQTAERGQIALLNADAARLSAVVDSSVTSTLKAGDAVKLVTTSAGIPHVAPVSADTDKVFGFVVFNPVKNDGVSAGERVEVAYTGSFMYMVASAAIAAGADVSYTSSTGKVATTATDGVVCGMALDAASAADDLIRVYVKTI